MTAIETYKYRGYEIVPMWQWSSWCAGVYATCADSPLLGYHSRYHGGRRQGPLLRPAHRIDRLLADE